VILINHHILLKLSKKYNIPNALAWLTH